MHIDLNVKAKIIKFIEENISNLEIGRQLLNTKPKAQYKEKILIIWASSKFNICSSKDILQKTKGKKLKRKQQTGRGFTNPVSDKAFLFVILEEFLQPKIGRQINH